MSDYLVWASKMLDRAVARQAAMPVRTCYAFAVWEATVLACLLEEGY